MRHAAMAPGHPKLAGIAALGLTLLLAPPGVGAVIQGYEIIVTQASLAAGNTSSVLAHCPSGTKVLGGGFTIETPTDVKLFSSLPGDGQGNVSETTWEVFVQNTGTASRLVSAIAICAKAK